ncbi:probable phosphatase 2C 34, partial [Olea europaea subsp. europaea]
MGHLSSMFNGLARTLSTKKMKSLKNSCGNSDAREIYDKKNAKKNDLILRSSGIINVNGSKNFSSIWEEFGCQEEIIVCGIFDGHGPWGHFVAKRVRESLPLPLLCNWEETLVEASLDPYFDMELDKRLYQV